MLDFVTEELAGNQEWRRLLDAYRGPQGKPGRGESAEEPWISRVSELDGVDSQALRKLHGTLIALGFLKFEITGKAGMQYQLTPSGRQALEHGLTANAEPV